MKKALLILLIVNTSFAVFGQSKLRLGVNLDPVATWLSPKTNRIDKDGARPGINGGLMVEYYFHPNYGLVTGFNLGVMGGNVLYNDSVRISTGDRSSLWVPGGETVAYSLSYLSIPVGLKLKTNQIGYVTYFAELGFNQNINIGSRASSSGNGLNKDNVPKEVNLLNMSYFFGGGIEYNIGGNTSIVAGVLFHNGFVDVLSNNDHKAVMNYLAFRVGVLF